MTRLLVAWRGGDAAALDRLLPLVYKELRRVAHRYMRDERPNHPLQTTALVHEAYLRMIDVTRVDWESRNHFFAVSAQMMRRILVEAARRRHADKRGGDASHVALDEALVPAPERAAELLALDEALERLAALAPRKARVVELRYFGGLSVEETAGVLEVSAETVMRDWRMAKLWLRRDLAADDELRGGAAMTPERFEEVERVCQAALDRPLARARKTFLDQACQGDPDLRAEVESLLAGASRAESLLKAPAFVAPPPTLTAGQRLGPVRGSRRSSAPAGWARSGGRGTRGWSATSR